MLGCGRHSGRCAPLENAGVLRFAQNDGVKLSTINYNYNYNCNYNYNYNYNYHYYCNYHCHCALLLPTITC